MPQVGRPGVLRDVERVRARPVVTPEARGFFVSCVRPRDAINLNQETNRLIIVGPDFRGAFEKSGRRSSTLPSQIGASVKVMRLKGIGSNAIAFSNSSFASHTLSRRKALAAGGMRFSQLVV